jgi:hypothetical protein
MLPGILKKGFMSIHFFKSRNRHYCLVSLMWMCLECLKNYFHLWGLQKSLVATPLVIFSIAPLVKTNFLDSPVTAQ